MTTARSTPFPLAEQFPSVAAGLPGHRYPRLRAIRDGAIERARRAGAPTPRVERWKYTNLQPLLQASFAAAPDGRARAADAAAFPGLDLAGHRLVFHNGMLRPDLSDIAGLPEGLTVASLAELLAERPEEIASYLESPPGGTEDGLLALNTAFMTDGCFIRIAAGVTLDRPIVLMHAGDAAAGAVAFHPRHIVLAGPGSRATLVELYEGIGAGGAYWCNLAAELRVQARAEIRHYQMLANGPEAFHIGRSAVRVAAGGRYDSFVLTAGGRLTRNEILVALEGEGASCRLAGAYLGRGRQHCDNTTEIVHASPRTESREVYKGVLDERARGVFQGRIVVAKDAQKSDGYQLSKTLLLSDGAEIDTKPELEIHADDVKCSHGATAGELEEDALFYLRARGIDAMEARRLLIRAFLGEVIEEIADESVRPLIERRIASWLDELAGGAAK